MIWTIILKNGSNFVIQGERHSMNECYRILRERDVAFEEVAGIFQGSHNSVSIDKKYF